ncbi:iron complex transport system substrate-binding protein, partial [Propionibacterium cyclohexanicum]
EPPSSEDLDPSPHTDAPPDRATCPTPSSMKSPIDHAWGQTTIEKAPSRIANSGWSGEDAVLALGVVPVGIPKGNYGQLDSNGLLPWTAAALDKLGASGDRLPKIYDETDSINAEAIADTEPDLILGVSSGITKEQYETLSKIAPTIPYTSKIAWGASWRDVMTVTAKAMGRTAQGSSVIADCEKAIAAAVDAHAGLRGKSAAMMYIDPKKLSTISLYTAADSRSAYLTDLGLTVPASVAQQSQGTDSFYKEISAENAAVFDDVDIIVVYGDTASLLKNLQADPLLSKIPAISRGSVAVIQDNSDLAASLSPSVLSIPAQVGALVTELAKAADKVG